MTFRNISTATLAVLMTVTGIDYAAAQESAPAPVSDAVATQPAEAAPEDGPAPVRHAQAQAAMQDPAEEDGHTIGFGLGLRTVDSVDGLALWPIGLSSELSLRIPLIASLQLEPRIGYYTAAESTESKGIQLSEGEEEMQRSKTNAERESQSLGLMLLWEPMEADADHFNLRFGVGANYTKEKTKTRYYTYSTLEGADEEQQPVDPYTDPYYYPEDYDPYEANPSAAAFGHSDGDWITVEREAQSAIVHLFGIGYEHDFSDWITLALDADIISWTYTEERVKTTEGLIVEDVPGAEPGSEDKTITQDRTRRTEFGIDHATAHLALILWF